ncbi:DUF4232 domain-containing protein [Streptomyces sp. NPDC050658]|uniref:DUF4232 domain-containing protein n=1 Tax=unclassified Streptomyces TaxID=2593676 RepID=UPI0034326925
MRTNRLRTTVLAAATAALALSLTACGGSDKADAGSSGKSDKGAAAVEDAKGSGKTEAGGSGSGSGKTEAGGGKTEAGGSGSGDTTTTGSSSVQPCKGDSISLTALHRFPAEEGEHLLLTAENADTKPCWVTSYPSIILGDTTEVLSHSTEDAPGGSAKITVKPGGKVYSAVSLFTDNDKTNTASAFSFAMRDQTGDTGPAYSADSLDDKGAQSEFTWSDAEVTNWSTTKPYDF